MNSLTVTDGCNFHIEKGRDIIFDLISSLQAIKLDHNFSEVIRLMLDCEGKIITTGMGKAGIAMRKFASTLCSLGFPSCYLHPGEASHGDLGLIDPLDILFVASTSGKTREVLEIMELAKVADRVIGITSHPDSPIREHADITIDMGNIKEAGQLKLAPTTSILVMLAITDALALVASEEKEFTEEDYALRHHSGYLATKAKEQWSSKCSVN